MFESKVLSNFDRTFEQFVKRTGANSACSSLTSSLAFKAAAMPALSSAEFVRTKR
jgi:hypothetical protein